MSGIAGVIRFDEAPIQTGDMNGMLCAMVRRGPDRRGAWREANVALGQTMLATTPEALAEMQPWRDPDSGCIVTSDSRLDNRPELCRELGLSRRTPDGTGDGELLHAAWQRWGERCTERLLGDFAFAIWDPRNQQMFCARDVMGVRPFYYHFAPGRLFAFASEPDALLRLDDVPRKIDEARIADALVGELEGIDRTSTFFHAITRLPPAHVLLIEKGRLRLSEYWHPLLRRPTGLPRSEGEWIEALHDQLQQAVRCRLRSTGRVGSMLSGGLDSSSVVALASGLLGAEGRGRLPTFSAINSQGECVETRAIVSMLESFATEATTVDLRSIEEMAPALRECLPLLGEPFDGSMLLIGAQYQAAASSGVRCLMDGMPADNLFTANGHVHQMARRGSWLRAYRVARGANRAEHKNFSRLRALKTLIGALAPSPARRLRELQTDRSFFTATLLNGTLIHRDFARRVRLWDRYRKYRADVAATNAWAPSGRAMSSMTAAYITAAVERYGRIAAYHGVEPRHPYLDRRLIEFHAWLPVELRERDGWPKWVLRKAMQKVLPPDVAWRRDKEHLGLLVNMAVVGSRCTDVAAESTTGWNSGAYLDPEKLHTAITAWRERQDAQAFEILQSAALVKWWLRGQSNLRPRA